MSYCTPQELRTQIERSGTSGSADDAALSIIIDAVSQLIDSYCNRPDGFVAAPVYSNRVYIGRGRPWVFIDDCISVNSVSVKLSAYDSDYTALDATDWIAFSGDPIFPDFEHLPYCGLMISPSSGYGTFPSGLWINNDRRYATPTVQVNAHWGYADSTPPLIRQATIALAARWFKQAQSAWTDTLASSEFGGLIYRAQNADIRMMLEQGRFVRPVVG
jgi:hypothetical protein